MSERERKNAELRSMHQELHKMTQLISSLQQQPLNRSTSQRQVLQQSDLNKKQAQFTMPQ